MWYIAVFFLASVFYYIGNHEYHQKGWLLALISILLSYGVTIFTPTAFIGVVGINLLLYIGIWVYNTLSGKPPRSSSGF